MFSQKIAAVLCLLVVSFTALSASASYWDRDHRRPGHGRDQGRTGPNHPGHGYGTWQYDGQRSGPIHGSPWGINYCGTENPQHCYQRVTLCYINSGYWWDNVNQVNWFNVYRCR